MKQRVLLDTNILIYYFNGKIEGEKVEKILRESFNISIITKIEFMGWSGFAGDANMRAKGEEFLSYAVVHDLTEDIAEKTIRLRQHHKIKTPDAIIAATALVLDFGLVTHNTRDFEKLDLPLLHLG